MPRSYDKFSNLPQFSGDSKNAKVIDSDMEEDGILAEGSRDGREEGRKEERK